MPGRAACRHSHRRRAFSRDGRKIKCVVHSREEGGSALQRGSGGRGTQRSPPSTERLRMRTHSMTKTPPNRRGITFEVGAPLEARDSLKNWYTASIEKIDYEEERVLIHYRRWSHRYDEWFDWSSPYLRPVERIQLRREGLKENGSRSGFRVNEKVLASWSDCRFYPAKVLSVNKDASYTVKFFDGVVQTVKEIHVKPFLKEKKGGRPKRQDKKGDQHAHKKQPSDMERKPLENVGRTQECGNGNNGRVRRSSEDHDEESSEGDEAVKQSKENKTGAEREQTAAEGGQLTEVSQGPGVRDGNITRPASGEVNGVKGRESENKLQDCCMQQGVVEIKTEENISEPPAELKAGGGKVSRVRCVQSSRRRTRSSADKIHSKDFKTTDPSDQKLYKATVATVVSAAAVGKEEPQDISDQSAVPCAAGVEGQFPSIQAPVARGAHLPNPNKYSREPLYRVVKNQPPPVLSINLDHNPFKCKAPGCFKSFRKAKLLHYHVKYYHGGDESAEGELSPTRSIQTRASERQMMALESPRTRRSTSATRNAFLRNSNRGLDPSRIARRNERKRKKSNKVQAEKTGCKPTETQHSVVQTDGGRLKERKRFGFLRIKLKKRKKRKKKSKSDEDSGSNWSTDTPTWSEEELDMVTPPRAREADEADQDSEVVRCICKVQEENGFMIQCKDCLTWQHITCMGITEDHVPERYSCHMCRDPPGRRRSLCYRYDWDWLSSGHMFGLSFLEENYSRQNAKKIVATHQLLGDVHHVLQVLNSLRLKMDILQSQSHRDLKLWRQPWKVADWPRKKGGTERGLVPNPVMEVELEHGGGAGRGQPATIEKLYRGPSVQDSYISSEHCYQKPRAYYPAVEQRLVVETRPSELEDSLRSTEDLLALEHCYGGPLDPDRGKIHPTLEWASRVKKADCCKKLCMESGCEDSMVKVEAGEADGHEQQQQWQMNLLEHIEALQEEVTHRMDFIEKELDVLESWLDYTGELEPPEPLARLPQLKQRVKQLLAELAKVQQIALCCST
ncbi:PHD finger protein 20-like [Arapaima gigas]